MPPSTCPKVVPGQDQPGAANSLALYEQVRTALLGGDSPVSPPQDSSRYCLSGEPGSATAHRDDPTCCVNAGVSQRGRTHAHARAVELSADGSPMNSQLDIDLAQDPALAIQLRSTLEVHSATVTANLTREEETLTMTSPTNLRRRSLLSGGASSGRSSCRRSPSVSRRSSSSSCRLRVR